jgi:hypothetical protein
VEHQGLPHPNQSIIVPLFPLCALPVLHGYLPQCEVLSILFLRGMTFLCQGGPQQGLKMKLVLCVPQTCLCLFQLISLNSLELEPSRFHNP